MNRWKEAEILIQDYKCFDSHGTRIPKLLGLNILVGKNHSGKTAFLDAIEALYRQNLNWLKEKGGSDDSPKISVNQKIDPQEIESIFPEVESTLYGDIRTYALDRWAEGGKIKFEYEWDPSSRFSTSLVSIEPDFPAATLRAQYQSSIEDQYTPLFHGMQMRRINADRDIVSEINEEGNLDFSPNGHGLTDFLQRVIYNKGSGTRAVLDGAFLDTLNEIFEGEVHFDGIEVRRIEESTDRWEIYLNEVGRGFIPLGASGSGVKTVIFVLMCTIIYPHVQKKELSDYVFIFEELENNLHPGIQRKLFDYIRRCSEDGALVFLSTHSNIFIDLFSRYEGCNILSMENHDSAHKLVQMNTFRDLDGLLGDLDYRASDLLQANCIIWVEGPSDRIYLNRWIEIQTGGELSEGKDYQIVFYGGRLLSHLTVSDDSTEDLINLLSINRRVAILIDSDRKQASGKGSRLNKTKYRIIREIDNLGGFSWVTSGREIENYIPWRVVQDIFNPSGSEYDAFVRVQEALGTTARNKSSLLYSKVDFAREVCEHFEQRDIDVNDNLRENLTSLIGFIRKSN